MEVKKNQDYIVTIEDLSVEGEGIGKISEGELGNENGFPLFINCLLYTSPSPRD